MSNVRFNLRKPSAEETPINLIYRFNGIRFVYPTGKKVNPKFWDIIRMRATRSKHYLKSGSINSELDRLERIVLEVETEANKSSIPFTKLYLKDELDKKLNRTNKSEVNSFNDFVDLFISEKTSDSTKARESIKIYKTFRKHFNSFCGAKRYQFYDLSTNEFTEFLNFMRAKEKPNGEKYSDNQINKVISTGKTIIKEAHERGYMTNVDLSSRRLIHSKRPADNIYLNLQELSAILEMDLSEDNKLDETRDLFVIGCYTGLRYSDYTKIKQENISPLVDEKGNQVGLVLKIFTEKQREPVIIPLNSIVLRLLDKYSFNFPASISNQKTNEALKIIAEKAGIIDKVEKVIFRNSRPDKKVLSKFEMVASHTARRTFATNAYKAGIPIISIMKITGHQKTETFMKYIKITEEENAVLMKGHEFFK